ERMRLVDALVDDPDLHPLTVRRERRPPERRSADQLGREVEARVVRRARPDFGDTRHVRALPDVLARPDDPEPVQGHAVPPARARGLARETLCAAGLGAGWRRRRDQREGGDGSKTGLFCSAPAAAAGSRLPASASDGARSVTITSPGPRTRAPAGDAAASAAS